PATAPEYSPRLCPPKQDASRPTSAAAARCIASSVVRIAGWAYSVSPSRSSSSQQGLRGSRPGGRCRGLGFLAPPEPLVLLEAEAPEVQAEGVGRLLEDPAGGGRPVVEIAAHSCPLGPLARKNDAGARSRDVVIHVRHVTPRLAGNMTGVNILWRRHRDILAKLRIIEYLVE